MIRLIIILSGHLHKNNEVCPMRAVSLKEAAKHENVRSTNEFHTKVLT